MDAQRGPAPLGWAGPSEGTDGGLERDITLGVCGQFRVHRDAPVSSPGGGAAGGHSLRVACLPACLGLPLLSADWGCLCVSTTLYGAPWSPHSTHTVSMYNGCRLCCSLGIGAEGRGLSSELPGSHLGWALPGGCRGGGVRVSLSYTHLRAWVARLAIEASG